MTIGVFLHDAQRQRIVPSSRPVPATVDVALAEFDELPRVAGNFIGFVRADGEILQLAWNARDDVVEVDIPMPAERGSLSGYASVEEARSFIRIFDRGMRRDMIPGLRFKRWAPA